MLLGTGFGGQQRRMSMVEPARNLQWPSGCFDLSLSYSLTHSQKYLKMCLSCTGSYLIPRPLLK